MQKIEQGDFHNKVNMYYILLRILTFVLYQAWYICSLYGFWCQIYLIFR